MVRTSQGPAEKSKPDKGVDTKPSAETKKMERSLDLDDETWDRIESMARSQSIQPAEAVRRAITSMYGSAPVTEGFNTGITPEDQQAKAKA
jgi:predicted DNA-binding ribbon-helix-helix protein